MKAAAIGGFVFLADVLSKYWINKTQLNTAPIDFLGIQFSITHAINKGAAWGILSDHQLPLLILRSILVVGLILYLTFFNRRQSLEIPFTLIIVGALGNIIDYFQYGYVIDMFHFVFWGLNYPVFNIADSSIFIGVVWIAIATSFTEQSVSSENEN